MSWILGIGGSLLKGATSIMNAIVKWASIGLAYMYGRSKERQKQAEKGTEHARIAAEIDENVDHLSDDERTRWLFGKK